MPASIHGGHYDSNLDWVVKVNRNLFLTALALGEVKEPTDSVSGEDSAS